jgi:hypothetical protein
MRNLVLLAMLALAVDATGRRPRVTRTAVPTVTVVQPVQAAPASQGQPGHVATPAQDAVDHGATETPAARRISRFDEIRDGGFGVGSAAPIADGAQPMDHPVKAWRSTMTFLDEDDTGYGTAEPEVWFYDAGAAERSGFTRVG